MQREETEEASDESATRSRASHTVGRPVSSRFFIKEIKDKNVDQFPQETFLIKEIRVKNGVLWTTVFSTSEASEVLALMLERGSLYTLSHFLAMSTALFV